MECKVWVFGCISLCGQVMVMVIEDTSRARFMHLVLYRVEPLLRDACEDGRHYRRNILGLRVTSEWSVILKGGFQFSH